MYNQEVTFAAKVTSASGTPPDGELVWFTDLTGLRATATLTSGTASYTVMLLPGTNPVTAAYVGDTKLAGSYSTVNEVINQNATTTTLTSSPNPSNFGQAVTLTAKVASKAGFSSNSYVTFLDGSTQLGYSTINSVGVATMVTSALPAGSDSVTANYGGELAYAPSTSQPVVQVVNKVATATALTSSPNPSAMGQQVLLNAHVTSTYGGTPTGTVTFSSGTTKLGTGTLGGGWTGLWTSSLAAGKDSVTAIYGGDANFVGSTSPAAGQTVSKAATTTTVASSANPSNADQTVTFTATVAGQYGGTPTGSATFNNGTTKLGTGTLSGGAATYSTSSLAAGTQSITAVYAGDSGFTGSTSAAISQTVNKNATATALTASPNPSILGQSVTFTATVTSPASVKATGTVTFLNGTTTLGTGTMANGKATFSIGSLAVGSASITAVYGGDSAFNGSTSPAVNQVVNLDATTTTLASSQNPSSANQTVTFTATVVSTSSGKPTGTVTFSAGSNVLGTGAVSSGGKATYATSSLPVGTVSVTATYGGDSSFAGSASGAVKQVVSKANSSTALASSPNPSNSGQSVTFTASVTGQYGGTPSGTVTFYNGKNALGTETLSGGAATYATTILLAGTDSITAAYQGDSSYTASTSKALNQTVKQAAK
jgi:hypothetical protein